MYDKYYFISRRDEDIWLLDAEDLRVKKVEGSHIDEIANLDEMSYVSQFCNDVRDTFLQCRYIGFTGGCEVLATDGGSKLHFNLNGRYLEVHLRSRGRGNDMELVLNGASMGSLRYSVSTLPTLDYLIINSDLYDISFYIGAKFKVTMKYDGSVDIFVIAKDGGMRITTPYELESLPPVTMDFKREAVVRKLAGTL